MASIANFLSSLSSWLEHSIQLHSGPHPKPEAKQSQYNLRHFDFLQLHVILPVSLVFLLADSYVIADLEIEFIFSCDYIILFLFGVYIIDYIIGYSVYSIIYAFIIC